VDDGEDSVLIFQNAIVANGLSLLQNNRLPPQLRGGVMIDGSENIRVIDNLIAENGLGEDAGNGINIVNGSHGTLVSSNLIGGNGNNGIYVENSSTLANPVLIGGVAALLNVVLGTLEGVADEDQLARAVEVADREDAPEDPLQPDVLTLVLRNVRLEELLVGPLLDVDQVRDRDDLLDLPEAVPNTEVGLNHRGHRRVPLSRAMDGAARDLVGGLKPKTGEGDKKERRAQT
jgi:hypothetical protein